MFTSWIVPLVLFIIMLPILAVLLLKPRISHRTMTCFSVITAVVFAITLCWVVAPFAAETVPAHAPAPAAAVNPVTQFLQDSVFPLLTALFMGFLVPFINRLGARFKIQALTEQGNWLERLAYQGISLAEERAAQMAGSKLALDGNSKLQIAVGHILTAMPKVSREQAESVVHALLAQIPNIGATGASAVAPPGGLIAMPSAAYEPLPPSPLQA